MFNIRIIYDCVKNEKNANMVHVLLSRIVTEGEKREVWCLTLENVSTAMKPEDKEREQNMYKDVSSLSLPFILDQSKIVKFMIDYGVK